MAEFPNQEKSVIAEIILFDKEAAAPRPRVVVVLENSQPAQSRVAEVTQAKRQSVCNLKLRAESPQITAARYPVLVA
jgi:hypothetical protein